MKKMPMKFERIEDVIAADDWSYSSPEGKTVFARIEIGKPQKVPDDPNGDWFCPLYIEEFTREIRAIYGVGPVDALNNAMRLVQSFAETLGAFSPRATDERKENRSLHGVREQPK